MWSGVAMPNVTSCGSSTCARTLSRSIVCSAGSSLARVVGVLAHPARRVVPGVVGQREAVRARVQQQLARRRIGVVGDVEHGARADVDVAIDEHRSLLLPWGCSRRRLPRCSQHRAANPAARKRRFPLEVMKKFDTGRSRTGVRPAVRVRSHVSSQAEEARHGCALARASLRTRGRRGSCGRARRAHRASAQASASASCTADARQAGCGQSASARRGAGRPEEGGVRAGARGHRRRALELLALLGRGVHRARRPGRRQPPAIRTTEPGCVQREAGRRLDGRRRERVADDRASRRRPRGARAAAPGPCQSASAPAMRIRRGAGEQRAGAGQQPCLAAGARRQRGGRARGRGHARRAAAIRRSDSHARARIARRLAQRAAAGCAPASRRPARTAPGRRRSRPSSRPAAWNATIRALAAR